jgi:hypothetical protein
MIAETVAMVPEMLGEQSCEDVSAIRNEGIE